MLNAIIAWLLAIILLSLVVYVIFARQSLFAPNPEGYGTYVTESLGNCETASGFCSEIGYKLKVERCEPHPETGRGCLNAVGEQTFGLRVTKTKCVPTCRRSLWDLGDPGPCLPAASGVCLEAGSVGYTTTLATCVAHDPSGLNACLWDVDPSIPLPAGCQLNFGGAIATCQIGAVVPIRRKCVPTGYPLCGVYGLELVDRRNPAEPVTTVQSCPATTRVEPSSTCRSFETGALMTSMSQAFKLGWTSTPMQCYSHYDLDGTDPPTLTSCRPIETILSSQISDHLGESIVIPGPSCVNLCTYYNAQAIGGSTWTQKLRDLVWLPWLFKYEGWTLSLRNIPQPLAPNGQTLVKGVYLDPTPGIFVDYFGDPARPLASTECLFFDSSALEGFPPNCDSEAILAGSALICFFRPVGDPVVTGTAHRLKGYILGIQGRDYYGFLNVVSGRLLWVQADRNELESPPGRTLFEITETMGSLSIRTLPSISTPSGSVTVGSNPVILETLPEVSVKLADGSSRHLVPVISGNLNWDDLYAFLDYRQTRWNPYSCNAFYSYPPPPSYSLDITTL